MLSTKVTRHVKNLFSIQVWARFSPRRRLPQVLFEEKERMNAKTYQDRVLKAVVIPWAKNKDITFRQD